ncbi:Transposase [Bifidobacterium longum subsp. longum]|nr:Transposase [Bifidobacterium longum subsp. longum]
MGQQYSHLSSEERILIEKLHCEQHLSIRHPAPPAAPNCY